VGTAAFARSAGCLSPLVTGGSGAFAVSSSLPNLTLIMIKPKLFQDSKTGPLLHGARTSATCPVVHKQPKFMYFFKIVVFLLSVSSSSCLELRVKRTVSCVASTRSSTRAVTCHSTQPHHEPRLEQLCLAQPCRTGQESGGQFAKNHFELSVVKEKIPNNIFMIMSSIAFYSRGKINIYIIC